jgi:hypothetical protein
MYTAIGTYPDIAFAVQSLSQFTLHSSFKHITAPHYIFCYLKRTVDLGIIYKSSDSPTLIRYLDADCGSGLVNQRSIFGYIYTLAEGAIS